MSCERICPKCSGSGQHKGATGPYTLCLLCWGCGRIATCPTCRGTTRASRTTRATRRGQGDCFDCRDGVVAGEPHTHDSILSRREDMWSAHRDDLTGMAGKAQPTSLI